MAFLHVCSNTSEDSSLSPIRQSNLESKATSQIEGALKELMVAAVLDLCYKNGQKHREKSFLGDLFHAQYAISIYSVFCC